MILDTPMIALLITLITAVIGVAFGYGILTNRVSGHQKEIEKLQKSYDLIDTKLDIVISKMAAIEAGLIAKAENK